jgi:acyl carrier protein
VPRSRAPIWPRAAARDRKTRKVDIARIGEETRFKEDLDADSLDLYELVMELEDRYRIKVSEEQAAGIKTVGDAVSFVLDHAPA